MNSFTCICASSNKSNCIFQNYKLYAQKRGFAVNTDIVIDDAAQFTIIDNSLIFDNKIYPLRLVHTNPIADEIEIDISVQIYNFLKTHNLQPQKCREYNKIFGE